MVLFSNINVNQRVELLHRGQVLKGTVKYKGAVNTLDGDWVGLALDYPDGIHNGLYRGRRYFDCKSNHGVFVRAGNLRFIQNTRRRMFNKYNRRYDSGIDEELFGTNPTPEVTNGPHDPICVDSSGYKKRSQTDLFDTLGSRFNSPNANKFALTGSVSRKLPAATMTRPMTSAAEYAYTSQPIHYREQLDDVEWEPVASIPKTHMPHSAQVSQTRRGWDNAHWTRELSYPKARHTMKSTVWNDVSF